MHPKAAARALAALVVTLGALSCERCAPDLVAEGTARLSVRSAAALASLVERDIACGFNSESAVVTVDGEAGGAGTVTTRVEGCALALGALEPDCAGTVTTTSGSAIVTASKIITGHLTGDARNPVIPGGADAVTIALEQVTAAAFAVTDDKTNATFVIDGAFSASITPLLFADGESGLCTIPSRNARVTVEYAPSNVHIDADGRSFDVDVLESSVVARAGKHADGENALSGSITVFGSAQALEALALDPEYDAAEFEATWSCAEELELPLSGGGESCALASTLGAGAAALTLRTLGAVAKIVDADAACGFSSADVIDRVDVEGQLGNDGAVATFGIAKPCAITIDAGGDGTGTVLGSDCNDIATRTFGTVEVTGTKTIRGWSTGDSATPVVPSSRDAVELNLVVNLLGFTVSVDGQPALAADAGLLSGRVGVRTAQDTETGACSLPTPSATFTDVSLGGGALRIVTDDADIALGFDLEDVDAQNGPGPGGENTLSGTAYLDGGEARFDGAPLDPDYDAVDFQSQFICEAGLLIPIEDETCSFRGPLGQLTSRALTDVIDAVLAAADTAEAGGADCAAGCALGVFADELVAGDCTDETRASGSALLTESVTVSGALERHVLQSLAVEGFSVARAPAAPGEPDVRLTLSASISGEVDVAFAENSASGAFDVPSPVRRYTNVGVLGDGRIEIDGLTFFFVVDAAALTGVRGALGDEENLLEGTITVDGQEIEIPVDRRDRSLEPAYDAAAFLARYSCEPGYFRPVD